MYCILNIHTPDLHTGFWKKLNFLQTFSIKEQPLERYIKIIAHLKLCAKNRFHICLIVKFWFLNTHFIPNISDLIG